MLVCLLALPLLCQRHCRRAEKKRYGQLQELLSVTAATRRAAPHAQLAWAVCCVAAWHVVLLNTVEFGSAARYA